MGTYYKHTKTESVDVPYSFRCEQCFKDSGTQTATIRGAQAVINSNFKHLDEDRQQKLADTAHSNLVKAVKKAYQDATEKQLYSTDFLDECPYCHAPQSWAIGGAKKDLFTSPLIFAVVGVILGVVGYFAMDAEEGRLTIALVLLGICLVLAAGSLIFNLVKYEKKKKRTSSALQQYTPVIEWSAVQHILRE